MFALPSWRRHRLCLVFPLSSWLRQRLLSLRSSGDVVAVAVATDVVTVAAARDSLESVESFDDVGTAVVKSPLQAELEALPVKELRGRKTPPLLVLSLPSGLRHCLGLLFSLLSRLRQRIFSRFSGAKAGGASAEQLENAADNDDQKEALVALVRDRSSTAIVFPCVSTAFPCVSPALSLPFLVIPLPFHCLSCVSPALSLPFLVFPLPFHCISLCFHFLSLTKPLHRSKTAAEHARQACGGRSGCGGAVCEWATAVPFSLQSYPRIFFALFDNEALLLL